MNRRLIHLAALALPLLGLGAVWVQTERLSRQGTEWDVPVQGYDPRDLLRGHYVQFQYDWPGLKAADGRAWSSLCLQGNPPNLVKAVPIYDADMPHAAPPNCANLVGGNNRIGRPVESFGGRLYASQDAAMDMQTKLADPKLQGVIRVRLRSDGHLTPLRMTFRPRPPGSADAAADPPAAVLVPVVTSQLER